MSESQCNPTALDSAYESYRCRVCRLRFRRKTIIPPMGGASPLKELLPLLRSCVSTLSRASTPIGREAGGTAAREDVLTAVRWNASTTEKNRSRRKTIAAAPPSHTQATVVFRASLLDRRDSV